MKTIEKFKITRGSASESIEPVGKNGSVLQCPYGQSTFDDFGNEHTPDCGNWCPHFGDIKREKGIYTVHLSCGGGNGVLQSKKAEVWK